MKQVQILWTGGFDSTFRVIQLSQKPVEIIPYYISDKRISEQQELNAVKTITELLRNDSRTQAVIDDLIYVSKDTRPSDEKYQHAYKEIINNDFIGTQYTWLASFADLHQGIEMSIHKDDKAILLLNKKAKLIKAEDDITGNYYIIEKTNNEDVYQLFKNEHFPLVEFSKVEMRKILAEQGYENLIQYTWFCHHPINGNPCGICNPCKYTIDEGMPERFSKHALFRNKFYKNELLKSLAYLIGI